MVSVARLTHGAIGVAVLLGALATFAWATDAVRISGVRTIYTAKCTLGMWEGDHCFGRLVAGPRYRFDIDAATRQVRFSSSDDPAIRGEYSNCLVTDEANWSCEPSAQSPTIAHQMVSGHPVADPQLPTAPLREIQKWRWLLLSIGVPAGHYAI